MKRVVLSLLALIAIAGAGSLSAQGMRFGIGGGLVLPTGDYKKVDKMGWLVGADATYWLMGAPVGIRVEGSYSQTSHKDQGGVAVDGNSKIIGGMADVVYAFGTDKDQIRPYILGGIGIFNVKVTSPSFGIDTSETKVGFGGGVGVAFKLGTGGTRFFVEGKYVTVSTSGTSTTFLPIRAGFRFGK
ncbi:MAG TPA: outer membrane beta-barrel protein [Gemmatimonadales bacterium]|nr:outer membrane beta-barrel protein [Gemmatimonadales bacterium]